MSINRTRWLDKLRPAGASSGGWTEGPMAPVETTDAATVDQRCSFKHWAGWRHNHSNSKLCVTVRMGQANLFLYHELSSLRRGHAFFTFTLPATRFVRVILDQGAMRSSQGRRRERKKNRICACHPCASHASVSFKKKLPISDLDCHSCAGAMQQYPESHHLCTEPCSSVQKKKLRHPCAGAMQHCPAEAKASSSIRSSHLRTSIGGYHRFAPREHHERSFWRETWR